MSKFGNRLKSTKEKIKNTASTVFSWSGWGAILSWLKQYWWLLLLVGFMVFGQIRNCKQAEAYENLLNSYNKQSERHQKELDEIQNIQREYIKQQRKNYQEFQKNISETLKSYEKGLEDISEEKEETQDKIIKKSKKDPNSLTREIRDTFGIPIAR